MQQYTLKIVEIRAETEDTVTLVFKQPALRKVKYVSGQYLTLIVRINRRRYMRPYSFSSAPMVDQGLEITIKRVPGGVVSNHLCDQVRVGDSLEVMEPMGDFLFDESHYEQQTPVVLWGAGSGITPLISLAKSILFKKAGNPVVLVYGNRSRESVIFAAKIAELRATYPEQFSVWHFHTRAVVSDDFPDVIQGRISPRKVVDVLAATGHVPRTLHYICGPIGLKESVKAELLLAGTDPAHIFSEDFEVVKDPKELEDVRTRVVRMVCGGETHQLEVVKGKSILEAGLDALLELNYSCQTGHCVLCKGRLVSGTVKMIGATTPEVLDDNERILCCAYPLDDDVEIVI